MKKIIFLILSLSGVSAWADLSADFDYRKIKYIGTERPIELIMVYDYQQRTYVKAVDSDRPQIYNDTNGSALGAYTCENNTLVQVPLFVSGSYYVTDGLFHSLFLYRRATAANLGVKTAPQLRGLLEGVVRIDYQGRQAVRLRGGRDDCMKMLTDFFLALENGGEAVMPVSTLGQKKPSEEIRAAVQETAESLERGGVNFQQPPPTGQKVAKKKEVSPILKISSVLVPFYVNRYALGPQGRKIMQNAVPLALEAQEIIIYSSPDHDNAQIALQKKEEEEIKFISDNELTMFRNLALKRYLVGIGVPEEKIKFGEALNYARVSRINNAADALIEFVRPAKNKLANAGNTQADIPTGVQFVGDKYNDEQISVVIKPQVFNIPTVGESMPASGTPITEVAILPIASDNNTTLSEIEAQAVRHIDNTIEGANGQLLSDVINVYLKKNNHQMIWQVENNLDWRLDADFHLTGEHLVDTLERVLQNFPVQAILDDNNGIVRIKLRHRTEESDAENPVPYLKIDDYIGKSK